MNTRKIGNIAEDKACEYLKKNNYNIIERNFYTRFGEIDIIAYKNGVFHFIEVKSGITFEPIFNISTSKLKKIIKTTQYYIKLKKINAPFCIDAIIVKENIEHITNISL